MSGISFRIDDNYDGSAPTTTFDATYGLAFFKINPSTATTVTNKMPYWYKGITDPQGTDWSNIGINTAASWQAIATNHYYVVLYKRTGGTYGTHTLLAYKRLGDISGVLDGVEIRDWTTLMVKVTEVIGPSALYDGISDARYNTIKCFIQIPQYYPRRIGSTPEAKDAVSLVKWEDSDFIPIDWAWVAPSPVQRGEKADGTTINNMIVDTSLNTLNYDTYTPPTTLKAREIGLHAYLKLEAANNVYMDNFYIDFSPSTGDRGFIDGTGQLTQYP
jgi:hypothetical protein